MQQGGAIGKSQNPAQIAKKEKKKHWPSDTPMMVKDKWAKKEIKKLQNATGPTQISDTLAKRWAKRK